MPQKPQSSQTLMLWLGEYTGTMTYSFSGVSDRRGDEGFPANLLLEDYTGQILFELTAFHLPAAWQFLLPYSLFSSSVIEFTRNAMYEGNEYQFAVSAARIDSTLTGVMKMFIRSPDGELSPKGSYLLNLKKF
ncbi:MAG: hypothetical protein JXB48_15250 [Candidatus Latescibacteria bacterium]|nr:hypothetical protein [Candidatus Latescibacterota bacterium]